MVKTRVRTHPPTHTRTLQDQSKTQYLLMSLVPLCLLSLQPKFMPSVVRVHDFLRQFGYINSGLMAQTAPSPTIGGVFCFVFSSHMAMKRCALCLMRCFVFAFLPSHMAMKWSTASALCLTRSRYTERKRILSAYDLRWFCVVFIPPSSSY